MIKPRLLLVEAFDAMREGHKECLELDYEVVDCRGGREALTRLENGERFDGAVIEYQDYGQPGREWNVKAVRAILERDPNFPVAILTRDVRMWREDLPDLQHLAILRKAYGMKIDELCVGLFRAVMKQNSNPSGEACALRLG